MCANLHPPFHSHLTYFNHSWDTAYTTELSNHAASATDEGTVWFSDASAEEKILEYLDSLASRGQLRKTGSHDATSFLDLGTGNGHLLFALREEGWEGRMLGVDYSAASVQLARQIGAQRALGAADVEGGDGAKTVMRKVEFIEWDVLRDAPGMWFYPSGIIYSMSASKIGFDVVLDKGTFDAISLSEEVDADGRRVYERYAGKVQRLVRPGGLLVVTSCNWTEEELRRWFDGGKLEYHDKVSYPSFTFGGKSGSKVVTLIFRRRE